MNKATFLAIDHVSVLVENLQKSMQFYVDILGLRENKQRPDLVYGGAWLDVGRQQIHLIELPNPDPVEGRPAHAGRDRHLAVKVTDLDALQQKLVDNKITITISKSGRKALFCRDPDGNGIEFIEVPE